MANKEKQTARVTAIIALLVIIYSVFESFNKSVSIGALIVLLISSYIGWLQD